MLIVTSCDASIADAPRLSIAPTAIPMADSLMDCTSTVMAVPRAVSPSAIRIPISFDRIDTR